MFDTLHTMREHRYMKTSNHKPHLGKILKVAAYSLAIIIVGYLIRMVVDVLLARWLGVDIYGDYALTMRILWFTAVLVMLGMHEAVIKYIPKYISEKKWGNVRGLLLQSFKILLGMGLLAVVLGTLCAGVLLILVKADYIKHEFIHPIFFVLWLVPLFAFAIFFGNVLRSLNRLAAALIPLEIVLYSLLVVGVFVLLLGIVKLTVLHVVFIFGFSLVSVIFIQLVSLYFSLPKQVMRVPAVFFSRRWLRVSRHFMFVGLGYESIKLVDIWFLEILAKKENSVGMFAAATLILGVYYVVSRSLQAIFAPMIAPLILNKDHKALQSLMNVGNMILLATAFIFVAAIVIFGKNILSLFGQEFLIGYWPLVIVASSAFFTAMSNMSWTILMYSGHQKLITRITLIMFVVVCVVDVILIPHIGIYGAALSVLLSQMVSAIFCVVLVRRTGLKGLFFLS